MTTREILKQTGMTDEQINALDAKIVAGFDTVLTTAAAAEQQAAAAREAAEQSQRAQSDMYANQIAPALDAWANEKATLEAQTAFYKTQAESARGAGFIPKDAPGYVPPARDTKTGQFAQNPVPGSPGQYLTPEAGITAVSNVTWVMSEHQRLYGEPMPDDFETLMKESVSAHLPFRDHVAKKYKFNEKKAEIVAAKTKEREDKIRQEAFATRDKEWAERIGNNPNVRSAQPSQFSTLQKAQAAGTLKDPLKMSAEERRNVTRSQIQADIAANDTGAVN